MKLLMGLCSSGLFPSEYITAVVSGQALGGIFAAISEIISLTFGASVRDRLSRPNSTFSLMSQEYWTTKSNFLSIYKFPFTFQAKTTAFVYFMIGNVVLFVSIVTYIIMSKTVFFRYYTVDRLAMSKSASSSVASSPTTPTDRTNGPNFQTVLRKIWIYGLAEWLVFVVTLCIYPSVTVLVTSQNHGNGHPWNGNDKINRLW